MIDRLNGIKLIDLKPGDLVRATAYNYKKIPEHTDMLVLKNGKKPKVLMTQTQFSGDVVGPVEAILEGTGHYLTMEENPDQQWLEGAQMTIFNGELIKGGKIFFRHPRVKGLSGIFHMSANVEDIEVFSNEEKGNK